MAILMLGLTSCPLCRRAIEVEEKMVTTTHFIESSDHPLWEFSDSVMHYACFQDWDQRPLFVAEYNRLVGSTIRLDGTKRPMLHDGTVTTVSVAN